MKKIERELDVGDAEMSELRPIIDKAIADHFTRGFLRHRWDGDVLRLSGPGAEGTLVREAAGLRLEAELRGPASLMHRVIRRMVDGALGEVAAHVGRGV